MIGKTTSGALTALSARVTKLSMLKQTQVNRIFDKVTECNNTTTKGIHSMDGGEC